MIDAPFRDADGLTTERVEYAAAVTCSLALSEAQRLSLVQSAKSPTPGNPDIFHKAVQDLTIYEPIKEIMTPVHENELAPGGGRFTVIGYREWSDEYRVRTRIETSMVNPPVQCGQRISKNLSKRAARKITESCYYMAEKHGGFKTLVTGTFDMDTLKRITAGETTIQKGVSRSMDAVQKMYQRGWTDIKGKRHRGHSKALAYCWVVEKPKNEEGLDNPHVHMMINWRVKKSDFKEWSKRLESIWNHGFFHLEKVKDAKCAGAYMAKAAGYMTKAAGQDDQGTVRGNRYGISKNARAPDWVCVTESELGIMGKLIGDLHDACQTKFGGLYEARNKLRKELDDTKDKKRRHIVGAQLEKVREKTKIIKIVTSKYQLIIKGKETFDKFMSWAKDAGWNQDHRPNSMWMKMFMLKLKARRSEREKDSHRWDDEEWSGSIGHYSQMSGIEQDENDYSDWADYDMGLMQ